MVQELKDELIRNYEKYVKGVAKAAQVSRDVAREALHRAIFRMLVGFRKRPPRNPIVAWRPYIIEGALNELRMEARRRGGVLLFRELDQDQQRELLSKAAPGPTPAEQAQKNELAALAWKEVEKLPHYQREVIQRRCRGQSYEEIAELLGVERSTAESYWTRGIEALRLRFRAVA
jgi:RNA polymerase sigma factor (sigma-70 family)